MLKKLEIISRIGIFGTFLGHGTVALVSTKWVYLLTVYGFSVSTAEFLLHIIGCLDIIIALSILIYPIRAILVWAACWAFMAALSRCIAGEPVYEFVERSANWSLPLILLILKMNELKIVEKLNPLSLTSNNKRENHSYISR